MPASSMTRRARDTLFTAPLFAVAVVWVVFDDLFRSFVRPVVAWLARLRPFQHIEDWIRRLPPYPTMALFVIPLAVIEPFKIWGLYLIGTGHLVLGILAFVAAKVIGLGIAERLFAISRDKLLSVGWFAWVHARIIGVKNAVHAYLARTRFWPAFMQALAGVKASLHAAKDRLLGLFRSRERTGPWGRRFGSARRTVRSYLHPGPARTTGPDRSEP